MEIYRAFGLTIGADFPLPGLRSPESLLISAPETKDVTGFPPDVEISCVDRSTVDGAWSGPSGEPDAVGHVHGGSFRVAAGADGDHLMTYADLAVFHVNAGADHILCAPSDIDDPRWRRELLDTVLWSTALARGFDALHASAVEFSGGVLAIVGFSGGGKTSLAAELIRRGCGFFADDVVTLERSDDGIEAHPGPPLMNLPADFAGGMPSWLGEPIATIDEEIWVSVAAAAAGPRPLSGICLLDRTSEAPSRIEPAQLTAFDLRPHMFTHPFMPEREAARFEISADLLVTVPVWRIQAPAKNAPVDELADLVATLPVAATGSMLHGVA